MNGYQFTFSHISYSIKNYSINYSKQFIFETIEDKKKKKQLSKNLSLGDNLRLKLVENNKKWIAQKK